MPRETKGFIFEKMEKYLREFHSRAPMKSSPTLFDALPTSTKQESFPENCALQ